MGFCFANMLKTVIKFVLRDTMLAISWGVVKTTDVNFTTLICYGDPKERFTNCRGKQTSHSLKFNSDDITMRTPPCLDEELLTVRSARIIVYRGGKFSEEEKLLMSQFSVTQRIFGLKIRLALAKA